MHKISSKSGNGLRRHKLVIGVTFGRMEGRTDGLSEPKTCPFYACAYKMHCLFYLTVRFCLIWWV